jgi:hypothetical protein
VKASVEVEKSFVGFELELAVGEGCDYIVNLDHFQAWKLLAHSLLAAATPHIGVYDHPVLVSLPKHPLLIILAKLVRLRVIQLAIEQGLYKPFDIINCLCFHNCCNSRKVSAILTEEIKEARLLRWEPHYAVGMVGFLLQDGILPATVDLRVLKILISALHLSV